MASLISPLLRSLRLGGASRRPFLYRFRSNERRDAITYISKNVGYYSTVGEALGFQYDESYDDNKVTEKAIALRQALSQLASDFGRESMLSLQRFSRSRRADVISTGLLKLDLALGIGGLPKGRIIEIYGRESSGKTSLALHIIREAQKQGGYCAYLDAENALNPLLLESMNLNLENLLIAHPDSAENLLSIVNTLAKSGSVDVIVVDSVAALVPQFEIDHPIGGAYRDVQKQIMMQALRKISSSLGHSETIIIFLNQVRASVKSGKGIGQADEVTCGGNALAFYSAVRLRMIRKGALKTGEKITGVKLCVEVVKNKLGPAMKRAELGIKFGRGFCCESEVFELACEHGLIVKEGTKYMIVGRVFSDEHSAQHFLSENPELLHRMLLFLRRQLFDRQH